MKQKMTFEFITKTADSIEQITNLEARAKFHYFNANGLCAAKRAMDDRVAAQVDAGVIRIGWHYSRGSFNDYTYKQMAKIAMAVRVSRMKYRVTEQMLRDDIAKTEAKISEVEGWSEEKRASERAEILAQRSANNPLKEVKSILKAWSAL